MRKVILAILLIILVGTIVACASPEAQKPKANMSPYSITLVADNIYRVDLTKTGGAYDYNNVSQYLTEALTEIGLKGKITCISCFSDGVAAFNPTSGMFVIVEPNGKDK